MSAHDQELEAASDAWRRWCRTLEETGLEALRKSDSEDAIDLAEGLRHMARMSRIALLSALENADADHPYFWRVLGPDMKMGGDNPQGLYLVAPVNGTDTFRVRGTRGSARWVSLITGRTPAAAAAGLPPFGAALFEPDLVVDDDGMFEVFLSPDPQPGTWLPSDEYSNKLGVRQFFGTLDDVRPMDITIENLTRGDEPARPLTVEQSIDRLDRARQQFAGMVPLMQSEMVGKSSAKNAFVTDVGDPTSNSGGVPGGNAVTARWALEPHEALLVEVTPPDPCAYWDVQVGNIWYESWDYHVRFSGLTCDNAHIGADGSVTLVVSHDDPGTANWLETAGHREGHIAIRWQLSDDLPIPRCTVVDVATVATRTALPAVTAEARADQRRRLAAAFVARFRA